MAKERDERKEEQGKIRNTLLAAFGWIGYLSFVTLLCQSIVFLRDWDWDGLGISVLVGTGGAMTGAFAAFLASPYNPEDEKRLSRVAATIAAIVTGYILGKIIDPLVAEAMKEPGAFFNLLRGRKNSANALIALISFLAGFLGTYQFRAYLSGALFLRGEPSSIETARDEPDGVENEDPVQGGCP